MRKILSAILVLNLSTSLVSQQNFTSIKGIKIETLSNLTHLPLLVTINPEQTISIQSFPIWMQRSFVNNKDVTFTLLKTEKDPLGKEHYRFQQNYQNYKIENSQIITHGEKNTVKSFNGDWFRDIVISNSISLTEKDALEFALKKINAKYYKWENSDEETHMKQVLKNPNFSYQPKGDLVILPIINSEQKSVTFYYAYKFNIYAEKPLYRANVYVDAASGKIIKEQNLICTIDAVGSANTKYSGTQSITTDSYLGNYRLQETGRGGGIATYNLNNTTTYINTDFTNSTNSWTTTGFDQAATDAHFGAEKTYDYYHQTFNRNSIDDAGYPLLSYVHYDNAYDNAFWDGQRMTYGDGDGSFDGIMTALDVCGHEITHGLINFTAQLSGGEADALNEGFADIFGTTIEWFARPSQHDWLMGYDLSLTGNAFRNMSNPSLLGQPDTYLGTNWDINNEPHQNNGPCIYWYYLLSTGGSGTNDNGQVYNVSGITMAKAAAIAYRAVTLYMTPSTDYTNVRAYTIQAAKDLYGGCSNELIQTTNAWYAVGVGAQYTAGAITPNFVADNVMSCTNPFVVNFTNTSNASATATWYFGDGTTSALNNPTHTYTSNGIYSVKLVANGCTLGSKDSLLKTNYINVNTSNPCVFNIGTTTTTHSVCSGTLYDNGGPSANYTDHTKCQASIVASPGSSLTLTFTSFAMELDYDTLYIYNGIGTSGSLIGAYTGSVLPNGGAPILINNNSITIVQQSDPYVNALGFQMNWACSSSVASGIENLQIEDGDISIYPNPSNESITFSNIKNIQHIDLYSSLGQLVYSVNLKNDVSHSILIHHLADGIYTAQLQTNGSKILHKKIIKN